MEKIRYMRKLSAALYWRMPADKAADVLSDYEEFFASGTAEGKTEAQICAELGKPREAVREIGEALRQKDFLPNRIALNLILTAIVVLFLFLGYGTDWNYLADWKYIAVFAVVSVAALRFLFGGRVPYRRKSRASLPAIIICNALLLGTVLAVFAVTRFALSAPLEKVTAVFGEAERLGHKFEIILGGARIFAAILFGIAVYGYFHFSRHFFTVCANALCAAAMLNFTFCYLNGMGADTVKALDLTDQSLALYCFALITTSSFVFIKGRRDNGSAD